MRVVFLGSGHFAVPALRWLDASEHQITLVITQPARRSGRGRKRTPTLVHSAATELGLEVFETEDVNTDNAVSTIRGTDSRLGVVVAFGQLLRGRLLGALPAGCINLHASLLPKYRGAAPINWAIVRGEEVTGCTVFRIVKELDAGPVLSTRQTAIGAGETAGELHDRLAVLGVDAVAEALAMFEGDNVPAGRPQDDTVATSAPRLKKSDGAIDFARPADVVLNHIRGMTPWPGAATRFQARDGRWENVTITRARCARGFAGPELPPGTIDGRQLVALPGGRLEILRLKPSGGREMCWGEYMNGRHVAEGDRFALPAQDDKRA